MTVHTAVVTVMQVCNHMISSKREIPATMMISAINSSAIHLVIVP